MNLFGKCVGAVAGVFAAGVASSLAVDYWNGKSLDEDSTVSKIRRFAEQNKAELIVTGVISAAITYKIFHTKHVCVDDSGAEGYFSDGTVRMSATKLMTIADSGVGRRLKVEYIGDFFIEPFANVQEAQSGYPF